MKKIPHDMVTGTIHKTKTSGHLKITNYESCSAVSVVFIETGTTKVVRADKIRAQWVKDENLPVVCGVGYIGVGSHKSKLGGKHTTCYLKWRSMISRCYSEYSLSNSPSYKGCAVCSEWHDYQV